MKKQNSRNTISIMEKLEETIENLIKEHSDKFEDYKNSEEWEMGIDEAGRGPVLGPMVYGTCCWPIKLRKELGALGFADSKQLTEAQRDQYFQILEKLQNKLLHYEVVIITAEDISNQMLGQQSYQNLNQISFNSAYKLINSLAGKKKFNITEAYLDTVGKAITYQDKLGNDFGQIYPNLKFTVSEKADSKFGIVSAASIGAKVTRDHCVKNHVYKQQVEAQPLGSGYPADPNTKQWLKTSFDPVFAFPDIVRYSWNTITKLMEQNKLNVEFYEQEENQPQYRTKGQGQYNNSKQQYYQQNNQYKPKNDYQDRNTNYRSNNYYDYDDYNQQNYYDNYNQQNNYDDYDDYDEYDDYNDYDDHNDYGEYDNYDQSRNNNYRNRQNNQNQESQQNRYRPKQQSQGKNVSQSQNQNQGGLRGQKQQQQYQQQKYSQNDRQIQNDQQYNKKQDYQKSTQNNKQLNNNQYQQKSEIFNYSSTNQSKSTVDTSIQKPQKQQIQQQKINLQEEPQKTQENQKKPLKIQNQWGDIDFDTEQFNTKEEDYDKYDYGQNFEANVNSEFVTFEEPSWKPKGYYRTKPGQDNDSFYNVLMVAEKPSIAETIAKALSGSEKVKVRSGVSKFVKVHEFQGKMFGKTANMKVTAVTGHVFSRNFPKKYSNLQATDPYDLFKADTIRIEAMPQSKIVAHLKKEAQNVTHVILWLDNDREGENICFEVIDVVQKMMVKKDYQQFFRAKFSSLTLSDLKVAFNNLSQEPDYYQSISVDARQIIDLKIGIAFSRFQTNYFTQRYPDLANKQISFGPCQTPTLGFCVARHDEIRKFVPKAYNKINLEIKLESGKFLKANYEKSQIFNVQDAQRLVKSVNQAQSVKITEINQSKASRSRPEALNTVNMLKVASNNLGIGPNDAMHLAEKLYLRGYISYPRTETTKYASSFNFTEIVNNLQKDDEVGAYASKLLQQGFNKGKGGQDAGDHPPITCTTNVPQGLFGNEKRLYTYICQHFLASISEDAKYLKTQIKLKVGNEFNFNASGSQLLQPGFLEVMSWAQVLDDLIPSGIQQGQTFTEFTSQTTQHYTQPPEYLSESELIGLMEKNGIGTDASMATHIENICKREYVTVTGGARRLVPTKLGLALAHGYEAIDKELVLPSLRQNIEASVQRISTQEESYESVLTQNLELFSKKYITFKNNISNMDQHFKEFLKTVEESFDGLRPFSKCGKCNRLMKLMEKMGKMHCDTCDQDLDIPKEGKYKITLERFCPLDKYQLITFTSNNEPHNSFLICPNCYTKSPLTNTGQISCNHCPKEDCEFSMVNNDVGDCTKCETGILTLEPLIPHKVQISCNSCWFAYQIYLDAKKLSVQIKNQCQKCKRSKLSGSFKEFKQQVQKDQKSTKMDRMVKLSKWDWENFCIFCEPEFSKHLIEKEFIQIVNHRAKGKGRGRGRGRSKKTEGAKRGAKRGRGGSKRGKGGGINADDEDANIIWC